MGASVGSYFHSGLALFPSAQNPSGEVGRTAAPPDGRFLPELYKRSAATAGAGWVRLRSVIPGTGCQHEVGRVWRTIGSERGLGPRRREGP